MNILEFFTKLSYGELSNLSIGMDGKGQIRETDHAKILSYTNDGLSELYSKFILSEKWLKIVLIGGVTHYPLRLAHVIGSDMGDPLQFIINDPAFPFADDLVKLLDAYDPLGKQLPLNDPYWGHSLYTPQYDLLRVPDPIAGTELQILYQAKHKKLTVDNLEEVIDLPYFLENALQSFVASKVFSHMNGPEHAAKGQEHLMTFEAICVASEEAGLVSKTKDTRYNRFHLRGWI